MTEFKLIARYLPGLIISDIFGLPPEEVKRCGFSLCRTNKPFVYAADLESALEKGQRNWGVMADGTFYLRSTEGPCPAHTHECLAIGIQEIQPESAEAILDELIEVWATGKNMLLEDVVRKARDLRARSRK